MSGPLVQALEKRRQEDLAKTQPLTPGTLEWAWAQAQKPFKGYWDRQGLMAREGLAMADQGAQQVRQGDLSGLAGMAFGPLNYLSSPINALFPIEEAQTQLPKEVSPFVAGGLELMALAAPGPKTKGLGRGVGALVDDVTDAERAALASRLEGEAAQAQNAGMIGRARAGGEKGVNGYQYKGGQFLPSTDLPPGMFSIGGKRVKAKNFEVEPGRYEPQPSAEARSLYQAATWYGKRGADGKFTLMPNMKDGQGNLVTAESPSGIGNLTYGEVLDGYNSGARWYEPNGGLPSSVTRDQALANLTEAPEGITAYHGSPHTFDKFDMSKIGTGEGAQAYGHGLYFAENEDVARGYRETLAPGFSVNRDGLEVGRVTPAPVSSSTVGTAQWGNGTMHMTPFTTDSYLVMHALHDADGDVAKAKARLLADASYQAETGNVEFSRKLSEAATQFDKHALEYKPRGSMYQVRLNVKPDELLDWDRPLSEQPKVLSALNSDAMEPIFGRLPWDKSKIAGPTGSETGAQLWNATKDIREQAKISEAMKAAGVKGIRYKDQGSRGAEGGTYNYVIFDDMLVDILKRYAIPFTLGAGGAAIVSGQDMPPEVAPQLGPQA